MKKPVYFAGTIILIGAIVLTSGLLYSRSAVVSAQEGAGMPPAMPVETAVAKAEPVQVWSQFSGHIVAVDQADIRPQVSGRITEVKFEDGQYVKAGDVLMVIDPRPYEAALTQAKAALQKAETDVDFAKKEYARSTKLVKTSAISESVMDERASTQKAAEAAVLEAQAMVDIAEINLDYANVKAPISGKVSRAEITEGNLVQAGPGAPLLTSIVADEKVYVDFEVDDQTYLECARTHQGQTVEIGDIPVRVMLEGMDKPFEGFLHSFDNKIDSASGTVRARAIFDNASKMLLPGLAVSVSVGRSDGKDQITLSERAIGTDQDRKFVYVIDDKGMAAYREVKIGQSVDGRRIITSGLKGGELVITEGMMRIRPGMPVTPKASAPVQNTAPAAGAPAAPEKK